MNLHSVLLVQDDNKKANLRWSQTLTRKESHKFMKDRKTSGQLVDGLKCQRQSQYFYTIIYKLIQHKEINYMQKY